jgi:putative addiction module component (TIGR02574 family)
VTSEAQDVLRSALALSAGDRADLAAALLDSLESDGHVDDHVFSEAWLAEISARARRVIAGESEGIPWEEALQQARERVAARTRAR